MRSMQNAPVYLCKTPGCLNDLTEEVLRRLGAGQIVYRMRDDEGMAPEAAQGGPVRVVVYCSLCRESNFYP